MIDEIIEFCLDYSIDRYQDAKYFVEKLLENYDVIPKNNNKNKSFQWDDNMDWSENE